MKAYASQQRVNLLPVKRIEILKVGLVMLQVLWREDLVKHITFEFTEFDEATCNDILGKLVN